MDITSTLAVLAAKLDQLVRFYFSGLLAVDRAGRAQSFKTMVTAGMGAAKAAGLAGLMEADG